MSGKRGKQAVQALHENEERFERMFEQTPIAINITRGVEILYTNPAYLKMLGYATFDEVRSLGPLELFAPEFRPIIAENIKRRAQGLPVPNQYEAECLRKDGTRFPVLMNFSRILFADGLATVGFLLDVTENKRASEALRESQSTLSAIINSTSDMIWSVDPGTFGLMTFNQGLSDYLLREKGIQVEVGMRPEDIFSTQESSKRWRAFYRRALEEGPYTTEYAVQERNITFLLNFNILRRDDSLFGISVFARDITERKLAEEKIAQSERKYHELFRVNRDGIAIFFMSAGGVLEKFVELNEAAHNMLGYTREEMLELSPLLFLEDPSPEVMELLRSRLAETGIVNFDATLRHKNGQQVYAEFTAQVIQYEGQPAVMIIIRDVTDRKQREQELNAIAALSAALRASPTRKDMLPIILEQLSNLLNIDSATIEIIDPQTGDVVVETGKGAWEVLTGTRQPKGTGINAITGETLQPFYSQDMEHDPGPFYNEWARKGVRGSAGVPLVAQEKLIGFIWVGRRTGISALEIRLLSALADITAIAIQRATAHEQTRLAAAELAMAYDTTLEGWAHALELRDHETEGHTRRVVDMTVSLARAMRIEGQELENIRRGALLHDIGKMGIPDSVLLKPGTLNEREWEIMRRHTEYARDLLMPIEYLRSAIEIPYCHHEKWDGTGYPNGLKGDDIPLAARVFAVADVWDALSSDRPYRKAWAKEQVFKYIREQSGLHFDPRVVELFLERVG